MALYNAESGQLYGRFPISDGDIFSVSFLHSVNKSEVEEGYAAENGTIYLRYCLYSDFGAGVATETEGDETLTMTEHGQMLLDHIDQPMPSLIYIVGTVSDHILSINSAEISLRDLCGQNSKVLFCLESN